MFAKLCVVACLVGGIILSGCQPEAHQEGHDQSHDHDTHSEDSVHHSEPTPVAHTVWTQDLELFVEFDPLVVAKSSEFLIHLTDQKNFKPIKEGTLKILLKDQNGQIVWEQVAQLLRPGIFKQSLIPPKAGIYTLVFELQSTSIQDRVELPAVSVYLDLHQAAHADHAITKSVGQISFLKEAAWDIPFKISTVQQKYLGITFKATGELVQSSEGWILKVDYPKQYIELENEIQSITYKLDYSEQIFRVPNPQMSRQIQPILRVERSAYIPLFYQVSKNQYFVPAALAEVWVTTTAKPENRLIIPYSALLEQEGHYYVYVQVAGELFEKRIVEIVTVLGDEVLICSGVQALERVVSVGTTAIKLSALGGSIPAHDH